MNLFSFVDELMKVGAMDPLIEKHAMNESLPTGMVGSEAPPPEEVLRPDEAYGRLPLTGHDRPQIVAGRLGPISEAKDPIDQPSFNRAHGSGTTRQNR